MKITLPILGAAIFASMFISIACWTWAMVHQFHVSDPWVTLPNALWHTFQYPQLRGIAIFSLLEGIIPVAFLLYVLNELKPDDLDKHVVRGTSIVSAERLASKTRVKSRKRTLSQIEVAGVPIPYQCESAHMLLAGSTSSGKTTAADEMLAGAVARGDRVIVIDPNGHALSLFAKKGDVVLNPFDVRSQGWTIFNEYRKPYDFERFAKSVIPDSSDASAQQWHGFAQQLFAEVTRTAAQTGETNTERLLYWLTQASAKDLAAYLAGTAATGLFEPGAEKAFASTRFILSHHVSAFQYLRPGEFSLRTWLEERKGDLYITWREDMLVTLRPLVSAWVDILIASILTLPDSEPRPLWLFLDELASLQRLNSLEAGLTKGRKHGLRVIAGLQSVSQFDAVYGQHHAKTLRSCFRNLIALGCANSDPHTAKEISDGIGQCETERTQRTLSSNKSGSSTSSSRIRSIEPALLPSELMSLPPLHGFLKLAGGYPVGKIRLVPKNYPVRTEPFVER